MRPATKSLAPRPLGARTRQKAALHRGFEANDRPRNSRRPPCASPKPTRAASSAPKIPIATARAAVQFNKAYPSRHAPALRSRLRGARDKPYSLASSYPQSYPQVRIPTYVAACSTYRNRGFYPQAWCSAFARIDHDTAIDTSFAADLCTPEFDRNWPASPALPPRATGSTGYAIPPQRSRTRAAMARDVKCRTFRTRTSASSPRRSASADGAGDSR